VDKSVGISAGKPLQTQNMYRSAFTNDCLLDAAVLRPGEDVAV
jgi:hypothetical protein